MRSIDSLSALIDFAGESGVSVLEPCHAATPEAKGLAPLELAALARRYLKLRRQRERGFPAGLFADPGWDLLLDLFAARQEGLLVSVTSGCVAAAVPLTTALRWIDKLKAAGMIDRAPDPHDKRRDNISLTRKAEKLIGEWLTGLAGV